MRAAVIAATILTAGYTSAIPSSNISRAIKPVVPGNPIAARPVMSVIPARKGRREASLIHCVIGSFPVSTGVRSPAGVRGAEVAEALFTAYKSCGRAIVQTTMVCCMRLAIFALGDFLPTARFAWMMVVILSLAVAGDLIVLPSFLLVFSRQKRSNGKGILWILLEF